MKNYYSIAIPKPCHEDWSQMSPKAKGRFCSSCSKTVIDFTKMDTFEVQNFIAENKTKHICGHFKQTQLDSINIHIPSQILEEQQSFHKLFLLVLLIVMGSTLMNCTNKHGNKQKIDSIEVIDTISNKTIDVLEGIPKLAKHDSAKNTTCNKTIKNTKLPNIEIINSLEIIETTGEIIQTKPPIEIDSIKVVEPPEHEEMYITVGMVVPEKNKTVSIPFSIVESPPEFTDTPAILSTKQKRDYFSKKISDIVSKNFNTSVCLELKGRQRINTIFQIDTLGFIQKIRTRAPHPKLEEEAKRVLNLLPQFKPAKHQKEVITVSYALPIIFQVEE